MVVLLAQRGSKSYTVQCRCPIAGEDDWTPPDLTPGVELADEQILMDGNVEAEGHEFFSLGAFSISEDGTLLAYSVDIVGDERYTLRFKNLETGEMLADEIPDTAPGATWAIDHSHVFYMTVDDSWRPDTVWRHKLGTPQSQDVSVFHEPDERYWVSVGSTRSEKYLMIWVGSKVTSEGWMLESANPEGDFRVIIRVARRRVRGRARRDRGRGPLPDPPQRRRRRHQGRELRVGGSSRVGSDEHDDADRAQRGRSAGRSRSLCRTPRPELPTRGAHSGCRVAVDG